MIKLLPHRFEVDQVRAELLASSAWDKYPWRTQHPKSPHREASDIWLRYNAIENLGPHFNDAHEAVWYDCGLPLTRALAESVAEDMKLGGVLITKIPAGKQVYPHVDHGWHALHYEKIAVQIQANAQQAFCFADGSLSAEPGQSYWFNNQSPHWVTNESDEDRITLICCVRRH